MSTTNTLPSQKHLSDVEDAPVAVSFAASSKQFEDTVALETSEAAKGAEASKRSKPLWAQKETHQRNQKSSKKLKQNSSSSTSNKKSSQSKSKATKRAKADSTDSTDSVDNAANAGNFGSQDASEAEDDVTDEPPLKRQRRESRLSRQSRQEPRIGWMTESDIFSNARSKLSETNEMAPNNIESNNLQKANMAMFKDDDLNNTSKTSNASKTSNNMNKNENENELNDLDGLDELDGMDEMKGFLDDMPDDVLEEFAKAANESNDEKQIRDRWKEILQASMEKYAHLRPKLSKYDKIFVEGGMFEVKVRDAPVKNVWALRRALRMKSFVLSKHRRQDFDKMRSYGRYGPSYHFASNLNNRPKRNATDNAPKTVWGHKIQHLNKKAKEDDLQRWLREW